MATVLVIDRNPVVRMVLHRTLAGEGLEVRELASPGDGEITVDPGPDVILVEIETPEAPHLEPLRRLRALHPAVPIIACANRRAGRSSGGDAAERLGTFALLRKPVRLDELVETVHAALALDPFAGTVGRSTREAALPDRRSERDRVEPSSLG